MQDLKGIDKFIPLNQSGPSRKPSRSSLNSFIQSNYLQIKHLIPPETRKWIFSSSSRNHLQSSSSLIFKLQNPLQISDCESFHAPSLFSSTFLKCSSCTLPSTNSHQVSTESELHDFYLNLLKTLSASFLTKFEYKSSFISLPIHAKYIHVQNLLSEKIIKSFRCCSCCDLLSVGRKTGVKTSCNHFICITCSISQVQRCKICNSQFELTSEYIERMRINHLMCFASRDPHSLVTTTEKVFKLACGHLACEKHLKNGTCSNCGFLFEKFYKVCEKNEGLRNFSQVFCKVHKKIVQWFRVFDCDVFCLECFGKREGIDEHLEISERSEGISNDFSVFFLVFHSYCEMLFENLKERNLILSPWLLKRLKFARLLKAQDLYELIQEISQMLFFSAEERKIRKVLLFAEFSNKSPGSKVLRIENEEEFRFCFKLKTAMVLLGIVFAGSVFKYKDSLVKAVSSSPVWISIRDNSAVIFEYEYLGELKDDQNDIFFNRKVSLMESVEYFLAFKAKGSFLYGKPFTRLNIQELEIKKSEEKTGFHFNPLMGSPFLGFLFDAAKF